MKRKKLGFLKCGDLFVHDFITYKAGHADGNGYAYCKNVENGKTEKICIDCEVEEVEKEQE